MPDSPRWARWPAAPTGPCLSKPFVRRSPVRCDGGVIRRITSQDVATYKNIRLRALQDAPTAFASTYAESLELPDEHWQHRAAVAASGGDTAVFLAFPTSGEDECVGLAGGFRNEEDGHHADVDLVSMWVAPSHRGSGVAAQLVDAVLEWARDEARAEVVGLWVTRGNSAAQRLYERLGFVETGDVQPLPSDPCKDEVRMVFGLRAPTAT
jgi:GNAT superfamily N-acetyltransferase